MFHQMITHSHSVLTHHPVEQMRGQRQTGRNDLPGKGERVANGW